MAILNLPADIDNSLLKGRGLAWIEFAETVANALYAQRTKASITVDEMANLLGLLRQDILDIESGNPQYSPSLYEVWQYAEACGVQVSVFMQAMRMPSTHEEGHPARSGMEDRAPRSMLDRPARVRRAITET